MDSMLTNRVFPTTLRVAISEHKVFLYYEVYDFEANPDDIQDSPVTDPIFSKRLKILLRSDGLTLYEKMGVDFFTTFELLYPNTKVRKRLIRGDLIFTCLATTPLLVSEL